MAHQGPALPARNCSRSAPGALSRWALIGPTRRRAGCVRA